MKKNAIQICGTIYFVCCDKIGLVIDASQLAPGVYIHEILIDLNNKGEKPMLLGSKSPVERIRICTDFFESSF